MMSKPDHFQAAYDLGGDVAEAESHGKPLPIERVPDGETLWRAVMGDAVRADWPTITLPQLRAELDRGYGDYW